MKITSVSVASLSFAFISHPVFSYQYEDILSTRHLGTMLNDIWGWDSDSMAKQLPTLGSSLRASKEENCNSKCLCQERPLCFDVAQKELEEQTILPS